MFRSLLMFYLPQKFEQTNTQLFSKALKLTLIVAYVFYFDLCFEFIISLMT